MSAPVCKQYIDEEFIRPVCIQHPNDIAISPDRLNENMKYIKYISNIFKLYKYKYNHILIAIKVNGRGK